MGMDWHKDPGGNGEYGEEVSWQPDGPDELVGVLVSKKVVNTKRGPCTLLKIRDEDGVEMNVWCNRTSLKNIATEYDEQLIVGRTIGFRTEGKKTLDDGKTFFPYEIGFGDDLVSVGGTSNRVEAPVEEPF